MDANKMAKRLEVERAAVNDFLGGNDRRSQREIFRTGHLSAQENETAREIAKSRGLSFARVVRAIFESCRAEIMMEEQRAENARGQSAEAMKKVAADAHRRAAIDAVLAKFDTSTLIRMGSVDRYTLTRLLDQVYAEGKADGIATVMEAM